MKYTFKEAKINICYKLSDLYLTCKQKAAFIKQTWPWSTLRYRQPRPPASGEGLINQVQQ